MQSFVETGLKPVSTKGFPLQSGLKGKILLFCSHPKNGENFNNPT
ncbi:hypothetical protein FEM08_12990 [Flavobacterium gilvum]|nr:hypothetical protein FEM08_12990 [Flavobacterium gilvum]